MKTDINVNVESKTIEKSIDAAKGFLSKLLSPIIGETGLLLKDQVTAIRFKNQIKLLNNTQKFCEKNNINPRIIPLKLIYPLLDSASLEEDEFLQNKWAILFSNLIDSEQNIQNHVFPFLLSQISKDEFEKVEIFAFEKIARVKEYTRKLEIHLEKFSKKLETLKALREKTSFRDGVKYLELQGKIWTIENAKNEILGHINRHQKIPESDFEAFEIANLIRLGIIIAIPLHYGYVPKFTSRLGVHDDSLSITDVDIRIGNNGNEYIISELGVLFFKACIEKQKKF